MLNSSPAQAPEYLHVLNGLRSLMIPSYLYLAFGVCIVLIVVLRVVSSRPLAYVSQPALFTAAEWRFFKVLRDVVGAEVHIMGKVRIADLLNPSPSLFGRRRQQAFWKISSKHVDFVLVDPSTGAVLAAIELDDRSHQRSDRRSRDRFVNSAFESAGVRLLRVPVQRQYEPAAIASLMRGSSDD